MLMRMWREWLTQTLLVEIQNASHSGKWFGSLQKINIQLSYDSAIKLLNIYSREMKTFVLMKNCTRMFIAVLFIKSQIGNYPDVLISEWIHAYYRILHR